MQVVKTTINNLKFQELLFKTYNSWETRENKIWRPNRKHISNMLIFFYCINDQTFRSSRGPKKNYYTFSKHSGESLASKTQYLQYFISKRWKLNISKRYYHTFELLLTVHFRLPLYQSVMNTTGFHIKILQEM